MNNKLRLNKITIKYNDIVDLGSVAHFAIDTYNTLPQNQEFKF